LILTVVPFVEAQDSMAVCPRLIDVGATVNDAVGGGGFTTNVAVAVDDPLPFVAVSV
jgi:hypothetical protein